jgi:hypothetical protein
MDVTDLRRVAREGENLWTIRSSGSRRGMCMELDTEKSIDLKAEQQQGEALARAKLKRRFERVHNWYHHLFDVTEHNPSRRPRCLKASCSTRLGSPWR